MLAASCSKSSSIGTSIPYVPSNRYALNLTARWSRRQVLGAELTNSIQAEDSLTQEVITRANRRRRALFSKILIPIITLFLLGTAIIAILISTNIFPIFLHSIWDALIALAFIGIFIITFFLLFRIWFVFRLFGYFKARLISFLRDFLHRRLIRSRYEGYYSDYGMTMDPELNRLITEIAEAQTEFERQLALPGGSSQQAL